MKKVGASFEFSATDLVGYLNCHHLAALDRAVAEPRQHTDPPTCRTDADAVGGGIEVTLTDGTAIRIGRDVSLVMLRRVMTALRG